MIVYIYQLRENDKFIIDGTTYRKVRNKITELGLTNAINLDTGNRVFILKTVKLTPVDDYWQERITPERCQDTLL